MKCEICGFPKKDDWCSAFCSEVSPESVEAFKNAKTDDWILYPCSICGCVIDDLFEPGGCCAPCAPKKRLTDYQTLTRAFFQAEDAWYEARDKCQSCEAWALDCYCPEHGEEISEAHTAMMKAKIALRDATPPAPDSKPTSG